MNNSELILTDLSSSEYNSAEPRSRKSSNAIYKVPTIPSILTTTNVSPVSTPLDNSMSSQLPPSPTMKPKSSSILKSAQILDPQKSNPVVKRDSFSDAEGVSFIKKLLHKESMAEKASSYEIKPASLAQPLPKSHSGFMLKKSPSAGSNSYWSKFSNSQPSFLKKFFDKPEKAGSKVQADELEVKDRETEISTPLPGPVEEPVLGFSVAQKASFFMKLEHEQRFSKWRKNSVDGSMPISIPSQRIPITPEPSPRYSRQLTQPVTTTEVQIAANKIIGETNIDSNEAIHQDHQSGVTNYETNSWPHNSEVGSNISSYKGQFAHFIRLYIFTNKKLEI